MNAETVNEELAQETDNADNRVGCSQVDGISTACNDSVGTAGQAVEGRS